TGSAALPPDFPILTGLVLTNLNLTVTTPGGLQMFNLGSLGPGSYPPASAPQFASDAEINALTLSATLSQMSFSVDGGSDQTANSNIVLFQLLPSAGTALQAGLDIGVIEIESENANTVPEPGTYALLLAGLTVL